MSDPYAPPRAPSSDPPPLSRGELLEGFLAGWMALVGTYFAGGLLILLLAIVRDGFRDVPGWVYTLCGIGPWLGLVILALTFAAQGKSRNAMGVFLTVLSAIALVILLVAACFGITALINSSY